MNSNEKITDDSLKMVPNLKILHISNYSKITNDGLESY